MIVVLAVLVVGGLAWLARHQLGRIPASVADAATPIPGQLSAGCAAPPVPAGQRRLGRIEVRGLTKEYQGVTVVDDVSFVAEPGRVTGFLGPNGAGKTTTLRMLLGLVEPTGGTATVGGTRYADLDSPALRIGAVLEASGAHEGRTGRDHLRVLCRAAGIPLARADAALAAVGLQKAADRRVGCYSLGMRQRLGVAAALLGDPQVLVLDEPGNGLDPEGIRWLRELIRALAAGGRTIVVSSHQLAEIEQLADDLVVIAAGRVVATGTLASVTGAHPGLEAAFLELTAGKAGIR
jgi:ABC-2 type transport system ATP-binding protein